MSCPGSDRGGGAELNGGGRLDGPGKVVGVVGEYVDLPAENTSEREGRDCL